MLAFKEGCFLLMCDDLLGLTYFLFLTQNRKLVWQSTYFEIPSQLVVRQTYFRLNETVGNQLNLDGMVYTV